MSKKKDILFNCEKYIAEIDKLDDNDISFNASDRAIEKWRCMETIPNDKKYRDFFYKLLHEENDIIEIGIKELLGNLNLNSSLSPNCKYVLNLLLDQRYFENYKVFLTPKACGYDEKNRENKKIAYYYSNILNIHNTNQLYYQPGRYVNLEMLKIAGKNLHFTGSKLLAALKKLASKECYRLISIKEYYISKEYCESNNLKFKNEEYFIYKLNIENLKTFI